MSTGELRVPGPDYAGNGRLSGQEPCRLSPASAVASRSAGPQANRRCRVINVAAAATLLILATPLMIIITILIRLTSSGPVFYVQRRVGLNRRNGRREGFGRRRIDYGGELFWMHKFRTMYERPVKGHRQVWAEPDDPRITPIGRFLRKYRLDELPQLYNVLCGDMNLVGPRPEQPVIFSRLRTQIELYDERQRVRPGITGWAQVNQPYDRCIDDVRSKLKFDLEYIRRQSVLEDVRIMLLTVPVVILKRGAW